MEAKTLRRPANWQTFEELCKRLWGEIWNCPEIQMNGRLGQDQYGVDIFGVPSGESAYYGIQCKGKSEYNDNHPQFTEKEILNEIEKAKGFEPPLKKFYLATTALNDAKLQTFIRKKNLENINAGLFEIHLFCWESIVNLIDSNQRTHDWYIKNKNYQTLKSVNVTFGDNSTELTITVPFRQSVQVFREKHRKANIEDIMLAHTSLFTNLKYASAAPFTRINKSYAIFNIKIENTGLEPIEDYKILLDFEGDFKKLEIVTKGHFLLTNYKPKYDTFITKNSKAGTIHPLRNVLVSEDIMNFDDIGLKPFHDRETTLLINWKLLSKDFKDEGQLKLTAIPEIKREITTKLVYDPAEVRTIEGEIEDYITDGKEE